MADKEQKTKIQLEVYDEVIEVYVVKDEEEKYRKAANFVTERLNTYAKRFKGERSQHYVSLITMLDIAINPMSGNDYMRMYHSFWRKIVEDFKK